MRLYLDILTSSYSFALGEIRLVLAMLLWHFDVRVPSEDIWTQVPSYMLWEKKPLYVELGSKTSSEARTLGGKELS